MNDNGSQPTSVAFMQACSTLGIRQTFTSDHNPKGTADTAQVLRTLKEAYLWLHERWIDAYNEHYLHSTLGYKAPRQFEREYHLSQGLRFRPLDKWGAPQVSTLRRRHGERHGRGYR